MAEFVFDATDAQLGDLFDVRAFFGPRLKEELVRCRDCRYYKESEWIIATDVEHVCHFWHGKPTKVEPDGFCKWAERRESK